MKKKKLNKAAMYARRAHIAYDKQFKQQWQQVLDRREQYAKAVADEPEKQLQDT